MRYTIIDPTSRVSFVGSVDALNPLVAACAGSPRTVDDLLRTADDLGANVAEYVSCGLAVFDEHNAEGTYDRIHEDLEKHHPVFRVGDEITRNASLEPVAAGAIIFNLNAKRIVQLQNSWAEIGREGVIARQEGEATRVHRYRLPEDWTIAP